MTCEAITRFRRDLESGIVTFDRTTTTRFTNDGDTQNRTEEIKVEFYDENVTVCVENILETKVRLVKLSAVFNRNVMSARRTFLRLAANVSLYYLASFNTVQENITFTQLRALLLVVLQCSCH